MGESQDLQSEYRSFTGQASADRPEAWLAVLQRFTLNLVRALTIDQAADMILAESVTALGASAAFLYVRGQSETGLQLIRGSGIRPEIARRDTASEGRLPAAVVEAVHRGTPIFVEAGGEPKSGDAEGATESTRGSSAILPLRIEKQTLGALSLHFGMDRTFPEDERTIMETIAQIGALAMARFRSEQESTETVQGSLNAQILSLTRAEDILLQAATMIGQHLGLSRCCFAEWDREGDRVTVHPGYVQETATGFEGIDLLLNLGPPAVLEALLQGRTQVVEDARAHPLTSTAYETLYAPRDIRAFVIVPCLSGGRCVAALTAAMRTARQWTPPEISLIEGVAHRTWLSAENARLFRATTEELEERRRVEAALRESEANFRALADAVPGIVWTAPNSGGADYANQRWYEYTGLPPDTPPMAAYRQVVHAEDAVHSSAVWAEAQRTGQPCEFEERLRRADGEYRWFLVRAIPHRNGAGEIVKWFGVSTDIHAHRMTEKRLQDILASVPGVVWEAWGQPDQASQRINFVSDYVETMLGYRVEEWLSTPNFWLTIVHPEDRERAGQVSAEAWANGRKHVNEFRWITRDGRALRCEGHSVVILDENGAPVGMRGVTMDVTERWLAHAEIEALNVRLRQAMAETHHRVKNNLQIVAALLDLQTLDHQAMLPITEFARLSQHVRALAAVHDLLTEEAKHDGNSQYLSTATVLNKLLPVLQGIAGENRPLHSHVADARMASRQATSLALVVNELVSNAIKHSAGEVDVRFTVEDELARLEVCDDGPGFPPDFDPARAAHTGLELIMHLTAWDLQGDVRFENRTEGGARVVLTMPLPPAEEDGAVPSDFSSNSPGKAL